MDYSNKKDFVDPSKAHVDSHMLLRDGQSKGLSHPSGSILCYSDKGSENDFDQIRKSESCKGDFENQDRSLNSGDISMNNDFVLFNKFKQFGISLGFSGERLANFVTDQVRQEKIFQREEKIKREEMEQLKVNMMFEQFQSFQQNVKKNDFEDAYKLILNPLSENEDVETFLQNYERICEIHNWSEQKKVVRLPPLLTGRAQQAYLKLTPEQSASYETIKQAILEEYQLSAEHYRNEFRNVKKEKDETFKQFVHRQRLLLNRWLDASKTERNFDSLFELMLCEQFLSILTPRLHFQVALQGPNTAAEAAEMAFDYVEIKQDVRDRVRRQKLLEQADMMDSDVESEEGKVSRSTSKAKNLSKLKCFKCNMLGHKKKECTQTLSRIGVQSTKPAVDDNVDTLCTKCEKLPFKRNFVVKVNGKKCNAMRDTGADMICIKPEFVNDKDYLEGTEEISLAIMNICGNFKKAFINIDSPYVKGKVQCIVIPNLGPDILIGEKATFENGKDVKLSVFPKKTLMRKEKNDPCDSSSVLKNTKKNFLRSMKKKKKLNVQTESKNTNIDEGKQSDKIVSKSRSSKSKLTNNASNKTVVVSKKANVSLISQPNISLISSTGYGPTERFRKLVNLKGSNSALREEVGRKDTQI